MMTLNDPIPDSKGTPFYDVKSQTWYKIDKDTMKY